MTKPLAALAHPLWNRHVLYEKEDLRATMRNKQFEHHCRVAEFLAQRELPNATPEEQRKRALSILRMDLLGAGTRYDLQTRMLGERKTMAPEMRWDAWGEDLVDDNGVIVDVEQAVDTLTVTEQFMEDLKTVLSDKEFTLLTRVFVEGVSRAQLVDELTLAEPKYASPEGRKQATTRINVAIHRAKKKAMTALPERWKAFAEAAK